MDSCDAYVGIDEFVRLVSLIFARKTKYFLPSAIEFTLKKVWYSLSITLYYNKNLRSMVSDHE